MLILVVATLVAAVLISRLIWLAARRWPDSIVKAMLVNALSAVIAMIAAAYIFANGGPPKFDMALLICGGAQLIVLTFDLVGLVTPKWLQDE
ncbi:MAG: hypothetical protein NTAFB05_13170 [Nitrobacter sp.]